MAGGSRGRGRGARRGPDLTGLHDPELRRLISEGALEGGSEPEVVEAERPVVTGGGPVVSREEAGALVWARLGAMDESWARAGALPAMSQWWAGVIREWMLGGKAGAVVRAGRRGGKSTTGCCHPVRHSARVQACPTSPGGLSCFG